MLADLQRYFPDSSPVIRVLTWLVALPSVKHQFCQIFSFLGIGVDDLFVIIQTWDNVCMETTKIKESVPEKISRTMKHAVSDGSGYTQKSIIKLYLKTLLKVSLVIFSTKLRLQDFF